MIKNIFIFLFHLIAFTVLTLATQIGGLIYLSSIYVYNQFGLKRSLVYSIITYLLFVFILLPSLAPFGGRVALPLTGPVKPLNIITCLLNRHYVTKTLRSDLIKTGENLENIFPNSSVSYLDANFPFFDGFPLLPHLSHNDGKKIDLAFSYDQQNEPSSNTLSSIGYGHYEKPRISEVNYPQICKNKGYWHYDLLEKITLSTGSSHYKLNEERTIKLIKLLINSPITEKLFIEPHLKQRWGLSKEDHIKFHGCHAVRHDDHIHWQVK